MPQTKAASLVEDLNLYPRHQVDDLHVDDLVNAIRVGATIPAIIADKKSRRIVDGFHRCRAAIKALGDEATVKVEWREYENDAAMFMAAVALNASHGRKLNGVDKVRVVTIATEFGATFAEIAAVLQEPEDRVEKRAIRVARDEADRPVPLKRGFDHLAGKTLTAEQIAEHRRQRAGYLAKLAREFYGRVEQHLDDLEHLDDRDKAALVRTARLILDRLGGQAAA